jgi:hypothetical protein
MKPDGFRAAAPASAASPPTRLRDKPETSKTSLKFNLQPGGSGDTRCTFTVPENADAAAVAEHDVCCRSARFKLFSPRDGQVVALFFSPAPRQTANAIGLRIEQRLSGGYVPSSAEVCAIM